MSDYIQYYGLSANPFDIRPDSKFFFMSESHKEALASLFYVIKERKGFMLVVGEDGSGKTVLIDHLIKSLDENVNVVCFPEGNLPFEQMLKEILIKLKLPLGRIIKGTMLHQLNEYLIQNLAAGKNLVLVIDEAQTIPKDVMEELRLISNLETSTSKLLQIIFVGRSETETKLNARGLRQLKQRIGTISRITRLSPGESMKYIDHRLLQAGSHSDAIFSPEALELICKRAGGLPRKINLLCHNALFKGFERSEKPVSAATVKIIGSKMNLLTLEHKGTPTTGDMRKPGSISAKENTWLKKLLYFFLAAGCIIITLFLVKEYMKNIKPSAVSEEFTAKAPIIKEVATKIPVINETAANAPVVKEAAAKDPLIEAGSISKTVTVPSPAGNQQATDHSESADSPKPSVASAETKIRYKRIVDIGKGANLSSLILNNYNQVNTTLMDLIMAFNPEIADPDLILIDQKIRIPEITESNLIAESSDGSLRAHLGTFLTRKEAEKFKNIINIKNNEIEIIPRNVPPDRIWFRVMAGPFTKEEDCLQTIQALRQRDLLPALKKIPGI